MQVKHIQRSIARNGGFAGALPVGQVDGRVVNQQWHVFAGFVAVRDE